MLLIALYGILLSVSFWGWGNLFSRFPGKSDPSDHVSAAAYFFTGLSFVGVICSLLWCFIPVNISSGIFLIVFGTGYFFLNSTKSPGWVILNPWFLVFLISFSISLLVKAAASSSYYDSGLYYIQTIKWIGEYAPVPGLANLHIRFGNASAWHILIAAFDPHSQTGFHFDDLGELMFLWFVAFHGWNAIHIKGFERYFSLGLLIISAFFSLPMLSSPSPDLACGILGMQTLWQFRQFLLVWDSKQANQLNRKGLAIFIQSLFLVQIKLSSFPFVLVAILLFFLALRERRMKISLLFAFFGLMSGLALFYRSYILTGYLFFPAIKGPFQPDWRVSDASVSDYMNGVRGFARHILSQAELSGGLNYNQIGQWTFFDWFPVWAAERPALEWAILIPAVLGWILLVRFSASFVRVSFKDHWQLAFFTWLSGMMLLFWFSNAPDIRFGMAVLGIGFSFCFASASKLIRAYFINWDSKLYIEFALTLISFFILVFYRDLRPWKHNLISPPPFPECAVSKVQSGAGFVYYFPVPKPENPHTDQCWDAPLPCAPKLTEGLRFRGPRLQDGFRIEK